jgi:small nuclear ribonucleoprotein (snRNP)-like protein
MSQNKGIRMINLNSNKEKVIKENKRVQVKIVDGRTIKGRFTIEDKNTIMIDNLRISITDIEAFKRNSLVSSIFTSGALIYGGGLAAGFGTIIGAFGNPAGFWLLVPAAGLIYAGIKAPNIHKNHTINSGWKFEVITAPN